MSFLQLKGMHGNTGFKLYQVSSNLCLPFFVCIFSKLFTVIARSWGRTCRVVRAADIVSTLP